MKIKHWQGYGTVNAQKISRTVRNGMVTMVIKVTGDHEWGLVRDDEYDLKNWLVKRFDKNVTDRQRITYTYEPGYTKTEDGYVESCTYIFQYYDRDY